MIRVLVAEDSPVIREFLVYILSSDENICIVGSASNGEEAIQAVEQYKPDVITMDIHMPKMDGLEATRRIMEIQPTPIIVVSGSYTDKEVSNTFRALESGAVAFLERPHGFGHANYEAEAEELIKMVKLSSEVKTVRRWTKTHPSLCKKNNLKTAPGPVQMVAIGGSTGAPTVIQTIISMLPVDFPAPVLVVQHIAAGFVQGFSEWLATSTRLPVSVAIDREILRPGHVYIAPNEKHMGVSGNRIALLDTEKENGSRPSVSCLFRSVAREFGKNSIGILLTGMGRDGAEELKLLKETGATTIVQDKDSSVVYGMPGEAVKLDAAIYVLPPEKIALALIEITNRSC
jgi:two-component system chemotaxis response regulator CheB